MKAYFQGNPPKCPINDGLRNMAIGNQGERNNSDEIVI